MAMNFRTSGMFGKKPPAALPQPNGMPIGVEVMQQPAKPKFFGHGGAGRAIAGTIGDFLLQQSGMDPIYLPNVLQQRDMEERARMAEQQRMQKREDMQWEWQNKPKDSDPKDQLTRYMIAAGIDPNSEEARGMYRAAAQNAAYPVQGVPFTDEKGNSGIQFIRPGQMQGSGAAPTSKAEYDALPPGAQYRAPDGSIRTKGGSGGNVTGGFQR